MVGIDRVLAMDSLIAVCSLCAYPVVVSTSHIIRSLSGIGQDYSP